MDNAKVFRALCSELRREILSLLSEKPMTASETQKAVKNRGFKIKYRETIYRALETLVDSGLVEKFYVSKKGLSYKLACTQITMYISKSSLILATKENEGVTKNKDRN